jgi:hypothetical protein
MLMPVENETPSESGRERMYADACAEVGVPPDALMAFQEEAYRKFAVHLEKLISDPKWSANKRGDANWVERFAEDYEWLLPIAVVEMADLLTQWVLVQRQRSRKLDSKQIYVVALYFAEKFCDFGFAEMWLAWVVARTKGPKLPETLTPIEMGFEFLKGPLPLKPEPVAIPESLKRRFKGSFLQPFAIWPAWAFIETERIMRLRFFLANENEAKDSMSVPPRVPGLPKPGGTLGAQINALRLECRLRVDDLAEKMGIDIGTVRRHMRDEMIPHDRHRWEYEKLFTELLKRKIVLSKTPPKSP